jgi:hypothetical protein
MYTVARKSLETSVLNRRKPLLYKILSICRSEQEKKNIRARTAVLYSSILEANHSFKASSSVQSQKKPMSTN